jgi:hypothetical protein
MYAAGLIGILFHLGLFVFVCLAKSDGSGAKRLAVIGMTLLLLSTVAQWLIPVGASQWMGVRSMAAVQVISHAVLMLVGYAALGLIIVAVFTGRRPRQSFPDADPAVKLPAKMDPNPYSSPSN